MTTGAASTYLLGDREVRRIGYGAMQLEAAITAGRLDRAGAVELVREAVALGVDHIETATFYGPAAPTPEAGALVNGILRDALADADVLVATKIGAERDPSGTLRPAQRPAELRASVEANRRTLGVDRLDLVYLRRLDAAPGLVATGEDRVELEAQLETLARLRDAGAIGAIGLSSVDADQLRAALDHGVAAVQDAYNLLERDAEPVRALCREHDVAWVPFFPLGSGLPGRARVTDDPRVRAVAGRLGATPSQVGLAWLLATDPGTLLIPGTAGLEHLRENLGAADVVLDDAALAALG